MDRDAVIEAVVAFAGVALLAGIIMWIGTAYTTDGLTETGGITLVAAIGFFIVFMSIAGLGLSRRY